MMLLLQKLYQMELEDLGMESEIDFEEEDEELAETKPAEQ